MNDRRSEDFWAGVYALVTIAVLSVLVSGAWYLTRFIESKAPREDPIEVYTQISLPVVVKETDPDEVRQKIEEKPVQYFALTEAERDEVAHVLMCETGGADETAAALVAQCILNACEKDGLRPAEVFKRYQYADYPATPNTTCYAAIQKVFDHGDFITDEPVMFFYSPAGMPEGVSSWHETQDFVVEYGGHRYFKLKGAEKNAGGNQGHCPYQGQSGCEGVGDLYRWEAVGRDLPRSAEK